MLFPSLGIHFFKVCVRIFRLLCVSRTDRSGAVSQKISPTDGQNPSAWYG